MKNTFLIASLALALLLAPSLVQATTSTFDVDVDPSSELTVSEGEVVLTTSDPAEVDLNEDITLDSNGSLDTEDTENVAEDAESYEDGTVTDEELSEDPVSDPTIDLPGDDVVWEDENPSPSNVPLPSALILLGSGLLGLSGFGWYRKRRK